jgi:hypothetical protein
MGPGLVVMGAPSVRADPVGVLEGEGGGGLPESVALPVKADLLAGVLPADSSGGLSWPRRLWAVLRTRATAASVPPSA